MPLTPTLLTRRCVITVLGHVLCRCATFIANSFLLQECFTFFKRFLAESPALPEQVRFPMDGALFIRILRLSV